MSKVLIVDNNQHITRILNEVFAQRNHQVTIAVSISEALTLIDKNDFDVAFIDLELPDGDGLNVVCYLKEKAPTTVASIISGNSNINRAIESIKAGVFRFLKKPFDIDEIMEIADLAIKEHDEREKSSGKNDEPPHTPDLKKLAIDLGAILPMLLLAFIIQQKIFYMQHIPIIWGTREMAYMILSFAFCYSFVHITIGDKSRMEKIISFSQMKPLTISYILFAAILFFVTDFSYGRLVLISGYILGGAGLILTQNVLLPKIKKLLHPSIEGRKRIILKSHPSIDADKERLVQKIVNEPPEQTTSIDELLYRSEPIIDERLVNSAIEEHIPGEDWGSRLIREFMDSRIKRENLQQKEKHIRVKQRY
jgi:ActR/RegA family two-component response regulator